MVSKRAKALLELMVICQPDDQTFEHEHKTQTVMLSDAYQELAASSESFRERYPETFLRTCTDAELDKISEDFVHEQKVERFLQSEDYLALKNREAFQRQFQELFPEEKIRNSSDEELDRTAELLPLVSSCLDDLIFSLSNGPGPELTPEDAPDFESLTSLKQLQYSLKGETGKNFCNIKPDEFMEIFSDKTVKSIKDYFNELPVDCTDYGSAIEKLLSPAKYCISQEEVQEFEARYSEQVSAMQSSVNRSRQKKGKRRVAKSLIGVAFLFVPVFFSRITGLLQTEAVPFCTLVELILVMLFWFRG